MSGGTNSLTSKLAKQSNVDFQGVSIGTFARNLIYKNIKLNYDYDDSSIITHCEYCGGESSTDEEMYEYCCLIPGASNFNQEYYETLQLNEPYYIPQDPTWCIFEE